MPSGTIVRPAVVINATTKSGGNTLDASARVNFDKQSWNEKTPFNEPQADDLNKTYSVTVDGDVRWRRWQPAVYLRSGGARRSLMADSAY